MSSRIKDLARRLPFYPLLRAGYRAIRPKSGVERIDQRDAKLTKLILPRLLTPIANCVDVGAHRGDVLAALIRLAPYGHHTAVEPIPDMAETLRQRFPGVTVHNLAASDKSGSCTFHLVVDAPFLSGIVRRPDILAEETVKQLDVYTDRLDKLIPPDLPTHFIKVDVEGGEFAVFRGAERILSKHRPWILFEHGSAATAYGTTSADVFHELARHGLAVWRLDHWLAGAPPLRVSDFQTAVSSGDYWNWLAGPVVAP